MSNKNDHDTYIIPPNFIETGTFFGGMFRARNVIEAGILVFAIGAPVFLFLPFGLTTRIIILCLTALPVGLVALIGISGESLSQFLVIFLKYLRNRRVVGGDGEQPEDTQVAFWGRYWATTRHGNRAAASPETAHLRRQRRCV